jgi:abortive infection bacteriophage resistance protein
MVCPSKLNQEVQQRIDENIAVGLTYKLAAESAGVTYKTFNVWMAKGRNSTSGEYFEFNQHIQKCNADGARKLLERLNDAAKAGNCQICTWILAGRLSEEFGRRVYRKTNVVSENKNENVEITVQEADLLRKQILTKFDRV